MKLLYLLHVFLLTGSEVEHLIGVFDQDSSLSFGLGDIKGAGENGDLCLFNLLDLT